MKKLFILFLILAGLQITAGAQTTKCEVLWNNAWYPATILESTTTSWKIHYDGYGAEWDEWVGSDRIKFVWKKGDKVQVLWNTQWYKAEVLEVSGGKYKIHYDGYGAEWDEWITTDRMKN